MVDQKFDIVGIGNSIVDVIADIDDQYLEEHNIRKGLMSLVDLESVKKISDNLDIKTTVSGGSVANSIVCLAQNEIKTAFIGKVGKDLNTEQAYVAAERCALNIIAQAKKSMFRRFI